MFRHFSKVLTSLNNSSNKQIVYATLTSRHQQSSSQQTRMDLKVLVKRLEEYAGLHMAYESDNVGLLVEPSEPLQVKRVLVTNDLTEPVLEEAIKRKVELIISYHPAIYVPLKRLTQAEWKQRSIVKCIENRIAVYSPHTTWDSVEEGINDWIIKAFGNQIKTFPSFFFFNKYFF